MTDQDQKKKKLEQINLFQNERGYKEAVQNK